MAPFGLIRAGADKVGGLVAPVSLIVCALLPALSLWLFKLTPKAASASPAALFLLVAFPLSSFLLAVFLWRARFRIHHLEAKQAEAIQNAGLDPLSGLPNRLFFDKILESAIAKSAIDAPIALIAIDIDKFKSVNDTHGHGAGDRLICGIVERIRRVIREGDCLARVGGDEFTLMLTDIGSAAKCAGMAHRLHDAMIAPFDLGRAQVHATLSLGVALCPQDGDSRATLTQAADLALYRAKHEGRNRFAFFDKTMEQKLHLGMTIEDDLRKAIARNELTILYQPLMAPCGTRMQGLEALVRWDPPRARPDVARGVHPARREPWADRAARRVGAAPRLRRRAPLAELADRRQRLARAVSPTRLRRYRPPNH